MCVRMCVSVTMWSMHVKVMTAESALRWCSSASGWVEFSARTLRAGEKVDLLFLSEAELKDIDEASDLIDWR